MSALTVVCLKTGNKYPDQYVTRLKSMVSRHLPIPHDFICYTDKPVKDVVCYPPLTNLKSWWGKMMFFAPELPGILPNTAILYFDLDMIIIDDTSDLVMEGKRFATIKHWKKRLKRPDTILNYNTSCMYFGHSGSIVEVWDRFIGVKQMPGRNAWKVFANEGDLLLRGDQDWLAHCLPKESTFKTGAFIAYEDFTHQDGCKVVVCNTHDNHTVQNVPWVKEAWR